MKRTLQNQQGTESIWYKIYYQEMLTKERGFRQSVTIPALACESHRTFRLIGGHEAALIKTKDTRNSSFKLFFFYLSNDRFFRENQLFITNCDSEERRLDKVNRILRVGLLFSLIKFLRLMD